MRATPAYFSALHVSNRRRLQTARPARPSAACRKAVPSAVTYWSKSARARLGAEKNWAGTAQRGIPALASGAGIAWAVNKISFFRPTRGAASSVTIDRFQKNRSDPSVVVLSEIKRCQLPHSTQFFQKAKMGASAPGTRGRRRGGGVEGPRRRGPGRRRGAGRRRPRRRPVGRPQLGSKVRQVARPEAPVGVGLCWV